MSRSVVSAHSCGRTRRRWSAVNKRALVMESYETGMNVSLVARKYGIGPALLYRWRKKVEEGSLIAVESNGGVVPISKFRALERKNEQLERLLGQKTAELSFAKGDYDKMKMDYDIVKDALRIAGKKKLIPQSKLQELGSIL